MIPWFERPIIYDVRARPNLVESTSGSRDLQMVSTLLFDSASLPFSMIWSLFLVVKALFSSQKILQNFLDSPSHRIFRHMYEVLNIDKNKN